MVRPVHRKVERFGKTQLRDFYIIEIA